jgi:hypothetical protein
MCKVGTLEVCKKCPIDGDECSVQNKEGCAGCVCVNCTPEAPLCSGDDL